MEYELDLILDDNSHITQGLIDIIEIGRTKGQVFVSVTGNVTFDTNARKLYAAYYKLVECLRSYPNGVKNFRQTLCRLYG